jgi:catechol 2,3-dioxygenase-like lactoylglutathione lyase family enzyme
MPNVILDVTYGASDIERGCRFYDAALGALGIKRNPHAEEGWACWGPDYEALANGGSDEGAPGTRAYYSPTFYVAYVRDPDGNKLAAAF